MEKNLYRTRKKKTRQNRCMSLITYNPAMTQAAGMCDIGQVKQIDILPDDILLGIFSFYVDMDPWDDSKTGVEAWQSLVHVCRRWRSLVLSSPRRLNLRLVCTPKTSARDTLDIWPALPLIVEGDMSRAILFSRTDNNIVAALRQSNRVCQVFLWGLANWQLKKVMAAMQVPFPELTEMRLFTTDEFDGPDDEPPPFIPIPDSFLGGSAPHLRHFELSGIPFPGLSNLLLSATHLVSLSLSNIPFSGYISPEAMVTLLSMLSSLNTLELDCLDFRPPQSRPGLESRSTPSPKRSILPALDEFHFKGVAEYLEDLVTFIDAPQLDHMHITFFHQIVFDCPRLVQFVNCTPTIRTRDIALVKFDDWSTSVAFLPQSGITASLKISISSIEPDRQLSFVAQIGSSSLHPISTVQDLYIEHEYLQPVWKNDAIENTLWLQLLLLFTAVKNLYLSKGFAPRIESALQELAGSRITEVLPSLQNIFVKGPGPSEPFQEYIGQFVTTRRLSGHPTTIYDWDKDSDWEWI